MKNKNWFDSKPLSTNQLIPKGTLALCCSYIAQLITQAAFLLSIQEPLILQLCYTTSWHIAEDD